jgi:micrococcal nuclease
LRWRCKNDSDSLLVGAILPSRKLPSVLVDLSVTEPRTSPSVRGFSRTAKLFVRSLVVGLAFAIAGANAPALAQPVSSCHAVDGDTITCSREVIRIENIDAAEMPPHAKCAVEADLAIRAKLFVIDRLARGRVDLVRDQKRPKDRYGRTLALVRVDGVDLGEALIQAGLARPWEGKRRGWCG